MRNIGPAAAKSLPDIELWGGLECTVNRIGDSYYDQFVETGHDRRLTDLGLIADIGFAAVRYPVAWERVAPSSPHVKQWDWTDERLTYLKDRNVHVIAGLLHHGSGPAYTNLLDPAFACGLAQHAHCVAERYPWITDWTPINEPLTTARFSMLYGLWYPHRKDEKSFWLALLNQIDAIRLSMRVIRTFNRAARLIQTEDLGRTFATSELFDQAGYENSRRWMTFDLLCGWVVPGHPFWDRLNYFGFGERLRRIADDPCEPDVFGINHYLTSDRFLDHRVARYPTLPVGGNGRAAYIDTEAIRVLTPPPPGIAGALEETWERYRLPIALTEVHNGSTREEQMRWITEAWRLAHRLRARGIDVRAVTAWALLGSVGWDRLLTEMGGYESGVFDVRSGSPRPTAIVPLLHKISRGQDSLEPAAQGFGWWKRDTRIQHPAVPRATALVDHSPRRGQHVTETPILIAGATGTLGQSLAAACRARGLTYKLTDRREMDLLDARSIERVLDRYHPWTVINATGWVRVDDAEQHKDACFAINAFGAERLAAASAKRNIGTITFSSDMVFDGMSNNPYFERDQPAAINTYGLSKMRAEDLISSLAGSHLLVRTAAFFSPFDPHNFAVRVTSALRRGVEITVASDEIVTPTYVPNLCDAVLDLAIDRERGIWHITNGEALTWEDFARKIASATGHDQTLIRALPSNRLGSLAPRPAALRLRSERGTLLPPLATAIATFAHHQKHIDL